MSCARPTSTPQIAIAQACRMTVLSVVTVSRIQSLRVLMVVSFLMNLTSNGLGAVVIYWSEWKFAFST